MYTLQYPFPKTNIGEELNKTKDRGKQYFYTLFWHFEFTFLVPPQFPFEGMWGGGGLKMLPAGDKSVKL